VENRQRANQAGGPGERKPASAADFLDAMSASGGGEMDDAGPEAAAARPPVDMGALRKDLRRRQSAGNRRSGLKHIVIGALLFVAGSAVTAGTYALAVESGGGTYLFAGGAIVIGALEFLYGVILILGSAATPRGFLPRRSSGLQKVMRNRR